MRIVKPVGTARNLRRAIAFGLTCAVLSGTACQSNPARAAEAENPSAKGHHFWQWGMGYYYAGISGRLTDLDAARADWLLLRFPDLPPSEETVEVLNRLIEMNPRLKIMIRVWPMQNFYPQKGDFTKNTPVGLASRMMYDYFYAPGVKEKILAETRRQIRVVIDNINKPENVVGMFLLEEMPQFLTDMAPLYLKDGQTNWAIEAYREEIEAEYGKPFVWNDEARRWWAKKYIQVFDEIHQVMNEAGEGQTIFYWPATGYLHLDQLAPDAPLSTSSLIPVHLDDIVKPGRCDGLFGYGSISRFESEALRFARERDWPIWTQLSHPCFMRDGSWEDTLKLVKTPVPQNLGTVFFCSGSCAGYPRNPHPQHVDPSIPANERGSASKHFGHHQIEHTRRFFAQQKVGLDVVEKYLVPELLLDYKIDAVGAEQSTRIFLQIHNTKDNSWYIDPQQAILRDVAVELFTPAGIDLADDAGAAKISLEDIEADGYRVVSWPVRVKKGTRLSNDLPLRVKLTAANCPDVEIASGESRETIAAFEPQGIFRSGDFWVEPLHRLKQSFAPKIRLRALQATAKNPSITIGSSSVSYDGTLRAGQELQIGPGTEARLMPSNLVVGDQEVLRDPADPHEAKAWSDKEEIVSLRVMNPSKPGAKIRITLSGKVAGGAQSMIRLAGYKLPASYLAWRGEPLLVNALTENWQDEVSVDITLPPEADIREVLLYRHANQGTVWYGPVSVTPIDIPAEGIDVSDRVQGALPTIVPGMPEPPPRRSLVLLPTAPTVVEGEPSSPVRFVYSDQSEPSAGLPRMQVQVMQVDE